MDATVAASEPARSRGWSSPRGDLQSIGFVVAFCCLDAGATLLAQISRSSMPVDWPLYLADNFKGALLCAVPGVLAARLVSPGYPVSLRMCIRLVVLFVLGSALGHWLAFWSFGLYRISEASRVLPIAAGSLLGWAFCATAVVGAMYWRRRDTEMRDQLHRTRVGLLALKADRADAELLRLRTQIEPHFLFNTMATIVQMYRTDVAAANRTLARLIDFLSASSTHMRLQETTLEQELALTEGYLDIQRLRMGARLRCEIDVPHELRGSRIPPAALLTLVENAIKHGLAPRPGGGELRITAHRDGAWVVLNVADDGVGFRATGGRGMGLANLRDRTHGLYGGEASLRLNSVEVGGVAATMRLPFGPPAAVA